MLLRTRLSEEGEAVTELSCQVKNASRQYLGITLPAGARSTGSIWANSLSAHLVRQFSRALWLTHLLMRCVMRGAQATSTHWVPRVAAASRANKGASTWRA